MSNRQYFICACITFLLPIFFNGYGATTENPQDSSKVVDLLKLAEKAKEDSTIIYLDEAEKISSNAGLDSLYFQTKISQANYWYNIDSIQRSETTYRKILSSLNRNHKNLVAKTYLELGKHYILRSIFTKAKTALDSALYYIPSDSITLIKTHIINNMGILYDNHGLYPKALKYYMKALENYKKVGSDEDISSVLNNIAIIYKRQGDLESAEEFYMKAYNLAKSVKDSSGVAVAGVNLGLLYKDLDRFQDSEKMFQASLKYFRHIDYKYGEAVVLHNYGELKRKQQLFKEAFHLYNQSTEIATIIDSRVLFVKNNLSLAHIAYEQKNYDLSLQHAQKSLKIATENSMMDEMKDAHKLLSTCYETRHQFEKALEHFKAYSKLEDSLLSEKNHQYINKIKASYELNQKELKIEKLKNERALQDAKVATEEREKRLYLFLIIFLIILIAFGAFGYFRTRSLNKKLSEQKLHIAEQKEEIEAQHNTLEERNNQLVELNKEKDEIIAIVAHDLRSPLNRIIGLLDLIKKDFQPEFSDMAMQSAEDLRSRINHILDVEALNAREVKLYPEELSVNKIVEDVYRNFESTATQKGIILKKELLEKDPKVNTDINVLKEVCENLVSNAIKFSPPESKVCIKVSNSNSKVRFHFIDQGPGLDEKDHKHLFTKFRKLSAKPTGNEPSSGLGLAIVKKYVDALEGKVWCESEKGKGAEFIVELKES